MDARLESNRQFLANLFHRGVFQGHGFTVSAPRTPIWEVGDYTTSTRPVKDWLPWIVEAYRRDCELAEAAGDDSVPIVGLTTGTHIYAAALGARVHHFADSNPCALPVFASPRDADAMPEPDLAQCRPLMRVFELAELVQQELGRDVLFGPPDLQSGFDTACLVCDKASLFAAMLTPGEQEAVHRLVGKCARLFKAFLTEFYRRHPTASLAHCPMVWVPPDLGPWLSNDECGAISVAAFESFCLPELVDLAQTFGGLGMHCCADAEHQFASFRRIPNFYAFNRVAARHGYQPMLDAFGGPAGPVLVMGWADDALIRTLVTNAPPGTRLVFNRCFDAVDDARAWVERMRCRYPRCA